jgi:uncharacterized protein YdhG (YjbR/CyaY superfamily)
MDKLVMKKASRSRVSSRRRGSADTVDAYFAAVPKPARKMLESMRSVIRSVAPKNAMEVISYRIPAFRQKKIIVWYAAFSSHCSLFPTAAVIEEFRDELKNYAISKGTIQFPLDKALPSALIKRIVKARVAQLNAELPQRPVRTQNANTRSGG